MHLIPRAFSFPLASDGKSIAARIAMMAITTSSSISVKPLACALRGDLIVELSHACPPCQPSNQPILGDKPFPNLRRAQRCLDLHPFTAKLPPKPCQLPLRKL